MNFIAIDFETANYEPQSICQVGLAFVENSRITHSISRLVKPDPYYIIPSFIDIHGISPEHVEACPTFNVVWKELAPMLKALPLVAHNMSFDRRVLDSALLHFGLDPHLSPWHCSLAVSRKAFPFLDNHRLSTVCDYLEIELNHHEAESDARAAAEIYILANKRIY